MIKIKADIEKQFDELMESVLDFPKDDQKMLYRYMGIKLDHMRYPERYESRKKHACTCGAKHLHVQSRFYYTGEYSGQSMYNVHCPRCNTNGPEKRTELEAVRAWNKSFEAEEV